MKRLLVSSRKAETKMQSFTLFDLSWQNACWMTQFFFHSVQTHKWLQKCPKYWFGEHRQILESKWISQIWNPWIMSIGYIKGLFLLKSELCSLTPVIYVTEHVLHLSTYLLTLSTAEVSIVFKRQLVFQCPLHGWRRCGIRTYIYIME